LGALEECGGLKRNKLSPADLRAAVSSARIVSSPYVNKYPNKD
jgi:hypothetical protein